MLYFRLNADRAVTDIVDRYPSDGSYVDRHDFKNLGEAERVATAATEFSGERYLATDAGPHCSPRYDVVRMFKVGDKVSYSFNGDSYPCGVITRISPSLNRIVASDEGSLRTFYRKRQTGSWRDGGWFLTRGHVSKQNPSF